MSGVECSGRVQRYPGLFDVSRPLNVAVLNCSTRYIDLRAARWRSDLATHTPSWTALAGDGRELGAVRGDTRNPYRCMQARGYGCAQRLAALCLAAGTWLVPGLLLDIVIDGRPAASEAIVISVYTITAIKRGSHIHTPSYTGVATVACAFSGEGGNTRQARQARQARRARQARQATSLMQARQARQARQPGL